MWSVGWFCPGPDLSGHQSGPESVLIELQAFLFGALGMTLWPDAIAFRSADSTGAGGHPYLFHKQPYDRPGLDIYSATHPRKDPNAFCSPHTSR
jgi:hypothetical protein